MIGWVLGREDNNISSSKKTRKTERISGAEKGLNKIVKNSQNIK